MAPALVELSTSKERNSTSKKFIKDFSCMSRLDLELVEKIRLDSSSLYTQNTKDIEVDKKVEKENHSVKVMLSYEADKNPISNRNGDITTKGSNNDNHEDADTPTSLLNNCMLNNKHFTMGDLNLKKNSTEGHITCDNDSTKTEIERTQHPVAIYTPSSNITSILHDKNTVVSNKFSSLNSSLNSIGCRLHRFYNRDLSSHIACFVTKSDAILENQQQSKGTVQAPEKSKQYMYLPLKKTYDLLINNGLTDNEDDLDSKQRIPLRCKRQKSQRPAPSTGVLNQWKQNRAKIGSQCSWLTLKMAALDEKLSVLNKVHSTLKSDKIIRNHSREETIKKQSCTPTHNKKNGFITTTDTPYNETSSSDMNIDYGCSRTRPVDNTQHHKYVKSNISTQSPDHRTLYRCRCVDGFDACRFCSNNFNTDRQTSRSLVELCDPNFHPVLSQKSDISLAFLLEDTLRHQRINTKVTITKSKKKKKLHTSISASPSPVDNKSFGVKAGKKNERSKSDEYSRKRYAASSDVSSKLKKFRKLSESCDSGSKPSTPTNELASPLSQSLPSGGLSVLKRKKGSASVDYDINNIVIPYSMAASTRVERIQYKEIPTPGWRTASDLLLNNGTESDRELTDDETLIERHARCEVMEHRRFTDYFQPVRKQRSARTSEGPNSEPPSPYMNEDRSLVNTPVDSPNPSMTLLAKLQSRLANIYACPEEEREEAWLQRNFPLSDTEGAKLEAFSAPPSPIDEAKRCTKPSYFTRSPSFTILSNTTPRNSPLPSPSPLASPPTPDSNWTVKVVNNEEEHKESMQPVISTNGDKQRKGIVLKLAKK